MPADYKSHVNRKQKKPLPGFIWMMAGLSIGLFVAFLVYLDKQPASEISFGDAVKTELEKIKQNKAATTSKSKTTSWSEMIS